jgi:hypothetical protein
LTAGGGARLVSKPMPGFPMPSFQYHFVVLARRPQRYDYLDKGLDCIRPRPSMDGETHEAFYRISRMRPKGRPELPSHALYWTSIAYVLWDDFDPGLLELEQQQAMLDWLHWGGQLIVSGPDTLETLQGSFLGPYLPAVSAGTREISREDMAELARWSGKLQVAPRPLRPWTGVKLRKQPKADFVPGTGQLLVERPVGRGRIVASAFRLTGAELVRWPGLDSLFNACLMAQPADWEPRRKVRDVDMRSPRELWNAVANTKVRYFSRDAGVSQDVFGREGTLPPPEDSSPYFKITDGVRELADPRTAWNGPGVAAWNDFSPVAGTARRALIDAAGIKVPARAFVLWVIAGYLLVLVPANWAIFRFLGRVEWAWAAAPLIAIAGTAVVIRQAELNIGFVRSHNEIAVAEIQAGYPRAHVTRYTALYTSLATTYQCELDDPGGQALPFPKVGRQEEFRMPPWASRQQLVCRRGEKTQVSGFAVPSNAIDFIHSEEMVALDGTISLARDDDATLRVFNRTPWTLRAISVVRRTAAGGREVFRVERLGPQASVRLEFHLEPDGADSPKAPPLQGGGPAGDRESSGQPSGELDCRELIDLAVRQDLGPGQVRLAAMLDEGLPVLQIRPAASQVRQAVVVVAHLDDGFGRTPRPDANLREDAKGAP